MLIISNGLKIALDDALAMFYQRNLDLIVAQYNIDQAKADEIIASAITNPTLAVQIGEITGNPNMGSSAIGCNHDLNVSCGIAQNYSFSQLIDMLVSDAYYDLLLMQKNHWLAGRQFRSRSAAESGPTSRFAARLSSGVERSV